MKHLFLLLLILVSLGAGGQSIPSVKIDEILKIIDSSSSPVIVNFWATWCAPCVEEIPLFEKTVRQAGAPVRLILISLDLPGEYPRTLNAFVRKNKYTSDVYWLNDTNADHFCPMIDASWEGNIPVTLFINRAKNYRRFVATQLSAEQFKKELDKAL